MLFLTIDYSVTQNVTFYSKFSPLSNKQLLMRCYCRYKRRWHHVGHARHCHL